MSQFGKGLWDRFSRRARRYGPPPSRRSVRDWINEEKLVEGAKAIGGTPQRWVWPKLRRSYRQTLTIRRAFAMGAENFDDVRTNLWLRSLLDRTRELRPSIRAFYRRLIFRALRPVITDTGLPADDTRQDRRSRMLIRRMGQPSPLLAPVSAAITSEEMFAAYDAARFGTDVAAKAHKGLNLSLGIFFERLGIPKWIVSTAPESQASIMGLFSGLAQYPEKGDRQIEDSADAMIRRTKGDALINARHIMHVCPWMLRQVPKFLAAIAPENKEQLQAFDKSYAAVADALKSNPWRLVIFVPTLAWLSRMSDGGYQFARLMRTVVPPLQKLIARCQSDSRVAELLNDDNPWTFVAQLNGPLIEQMSGGQAAIAVVPRTVIFRVARLLWPYGLRELHRMRRPRQSRGKLCLSA